MEVDKLTAEVVRFMLFKSYKQPNVPVKREELAHLITENYKQRSLPSAVIVNAQSKLKSTFGLEMVEIHCARQSKGSRNSASQGDRVPEETLWTQLKRMGINEFDNSHPVFGNIKESIQTLVKQRYIRKEKVSSNDGDTWVLDLAERAQDADFKTQVQTFIGKIVNGADERR